MAKTRSWSRERGDVNEHLLSMHDLSATDVTRILEVALYVHTAILECRSRFG